MNGALPPGLIGYRAATSILGPAAAPLWLSWRVRNGKEEPGRLPERYGRAGRARPDGEFAWVHGASIGETLSLLPVIEELVGRGLKVVATSGTTTSAEVLQGRLPPGARHQYLPLDVPRYMRRFLEHWRPRLALFAESELWPNGILELERLRIPLVLVNARMSERSFGRWKRAPAFARALLSRSALCIAQTSADAERLAALGAPVSEVSGNLKFDGPPLPADPAAVETLAASIAGRPVWMAASTHEGEDAAIFAAHADLARYRTGALTILAPRHPNRGPAIAEAARAAGLAAVLRSQGAELHQARDVYVADTVGELGTFMRLAPLVFMGGTLVPIGGHNPFEPARLGAGILHGPDTSGFGDIFDALDSSGGALRIDSGSMPEAVTGLLCDPALLRDMGRAASAAASSLGGALGLTMRAIEPFLPPAASADQAFW